jgi:hypothetical protein
MVNPYKLVELQKPGFFRTLLNLPIIGNFKTEIINLLSSKQPYDINITELNQLRNKYQIYSNELFNKALMDIYNKALSFFYDGRNVSSEERIYLNSLRELMELDLQKVERLEKAYLLEVYYQKFLACIGTNDFTPELKNSLRMIGDDLALKESLANEFFAECAIRFVKKKIIELPQDKFYSLIILEKLKKLNAFLGTDLTIDTATPETISEQLHNWKIQLGSFSPIECGSKTQQDESCYYSSKADYFEFPKAPQHITLCYMTARKMIASGFYFRSGDMGFRRLEKTDISKADSGNVYITNKRIIYSGIQKGNVYKLTDILDFVIFSNGVIIKTLKGKTIVYLPEDIELFSVVLSGMLVK